MKVARERKSSVLASNAVHHRVDSLTGIVTLVAIIGANTIQNAVWLDPVGGLLISLMVVNAGTSNTKAAIQELIDQSIDSEVKNNVRKRARQGLNSVSEGHEAEVRDVGGVKSGQNYLIDLEMAVPGAWTVEDLREVENAVRTQVGANVRGARRIRIRFVSKEAPVNEKFDDFVFTNLDADPEAGREHNGENGHTHDAEHDRKHKH
jgi:divalent metal cation (Fe/Co/Zn/Cd) transporter